MKFLKAKRTIYRDGDRPLLHRWNLFECKWFSIKVHNLVSSDFECQHDHPWAFVSIILKGGYVEHTPKGTAIIHPGRVLYRPAHALHSLEIHQPAWTLVITFKKTRMWGFATKKGWIPWYRYSHQNDCEI